MRVRKGPALLVGVGVALVCAVNVAAAVATPAEPGFRVPFVDPYARQPADGLADDGIGDVSWQQPAAAPAAPSVQAASEAPASSVAGDTATTPTEPSAPAASAAAEPLSHAVTQPAVQLPRTLDEWVSSVATVTGIPARAVRAYGDATLEIGVEDAACHVGWTTLAAIGWIESGHGTHGGATLGDDGRPTVPIVGPALDGSPGRAAIRSTPESQAWHGDPVWDHAVGPMQFIPSTWKRWAADGDGDGVADPQDIDDAALATARYLCAGARDLSTWDGWHAAVLSYNHSEPYVQSVYTRAASYAAAVGR